MAWIQSAEQTITIASGATSGGTADLGAAYSTFTVRCADCSNIQGTTDLQLAIAADADDTPCDLYDHSAPGDLWGADQSLPTTGTWFATVFSGIGVRRVVPTLSTATSGGSAVFKIRGFDKGV